MGWAGGGKRENSKSQHRKINALIIGLEGALTEDHWEVDSHVMYNWQLLDNFIPCTWIVATKGRGKKGRSEKSGETQGEAKLDMLLKSEKNVFKSLRDRGAVLTSWQ